MRHISRSVAWTLPAVAAALLALIPAAVTAPVALTGTALYLGGTDHPLTVPQDTPEYIEGYVNWANYNFVTPSELCPGCSPVAVYGPNQFWPVTGLDAMGFDASVAIGLDNLDDCLRGAPCTVTDPPYTSSGSRVVSDSSYTVFSYSQSGTVASIQKSDMIAHPPSGTVNFVFVSNPNRPNGGILERFVGVYLPILDVTFNGATVTNSPQPTPLTTVDVVHQYDPVADFPTNPLNALAVVNSLFGFAYEHPEGHSGSPILQGQYQDSTYYLIATETLPMLRPLTIVPWLGPLLATTLDPPMRVLVETGYDRTINPGAPTPAKYLYIPNPFTVVGDFLTAIPNGWDNGIAYITGDPANRPFHTIPAGPYGVGGPPVNAGAIDPYGPPTPLPAPGSQAAASAIQAAAPGGQADAAPADTTAPRPAAVTASRTGTETSPAAPDAQAPAAPARVPQPSSTPRRSPRASAAQSASVPGPASAVLAATPSPERSPGSSDRSTPSPSHRRG
jgi:hypothetical protein